MKQNNKTKFLIKMVSLLFRPEALHYCTQTFRILNHIRKNHGILFMYQYAKTCRLHITRYICGKPLFSNSSRVSLTNGWPTKFLFLKKLLSSNYDKRLLLTLMTITRGIQPNKKERGKIIPSFSSITNKYTGKQYVIPRFFIDVMKRKYQIDQAVESPSSKTMFLNMKSSPSGISIMTCIPAALSLTQGLIQALNILLKDGWELFEQAVMFGRRTTKEEITISPGKLAIVHDPEGKERVIAMLDYWSQWALKPIHDKLLNILRKIPMDRTFTQDPFKKWKDDGEMFWSLDLTSATDRFPVFLQEKVLNSILPEDHGKAWQYLLTKRIFSYKDKTYTYAIGQPMGAYSSWPAFALCHHFVVQWAAYKAGYKDFKDYILLGDDIVIKNNKVAQIYISLMTTWGVDISKTKTHVSKHTYEFAKRWIHHGVEISPLPVKGIMEHFAEYKTVMSLLREYITRSSLKASIPLYDIVKESYKGLFIKGQWVTAELMDKRLYDFWFALRYIYKEVDATDLWNYLVHKGFSQEHLPTKDKIGKLFNRILINSVGSQIPKINTKVNALVMGMITDLLPEHEPKDLTFLPVVHACHNLLIKLGEDFDKFSKDFFSFKELLETVTIPGVNEITHLKRQRRKEVTGIDKVWLTAFRKIKILNQNFGNFDIEKWNLMSAEGAYYTIKGSIERNARGLQIWKEGKSCRPKKYSY